MLDILHLVLSTLGAAVNAAGVDNKNVQKWLAIAASLVREGEQARDDLYDLALHIEKMVSENRDPTEEEWEELKSRSDAAHNVIQSWSDEA